MPLQEARTRFKLVYFDLKTDESIIEAVPISGRTHQIRVHLAWLGFPIVNDPVYNAAALEALKKADGIAKPTAAASDSAAVAKTAVPDADMDVRRWCVSCTRGIEAEFNVMQRMSDGIFLHSYKYQGPQTASGAPSWEFTTPLPAWATIPS
jgi:23S rRNA-/tRNA-specific pseudouridylate synthase